MVITLTDTDKEKLNQKLADLGVILINNTIQVLHDIRFAGYNELGIEQWEIVLEVK